MREYFDRLYENIRQALPDNMDRRHCLTALELASTFAIRASGGDDDPPPPPPPDFRAEDTAG